MRSLAVIIFCLLSSKAFAYPIFFSCKADKSLSAVLTPAELASKLNQLAAASQGKPGFNKQNELHEACTNLNDCLRDFAQLLDLAKETGRTAQDELMRDITDRAKTSMQAMKDGGFLRISGQDMNFLEQFHELQTKNYQCQMARASQPAEKVKAGSRCMLGNFGHSPYMYVSGVRKSCVPNGEERAEGPVGCEAIDRIVEGAIAMGQDPFAALAISFMEQGTAISGLYLDPIGKVHSVGCATAPVSAAAANAWNEQMRSSQPYKACQDACNNGVQDYQQCYDQCGIRFNRPYNLESYSTFYKVNRETRTDPALIKKLRDYVKLNNESGAPIVNSPSKYCPVEGCCLSLDFKADHASIEKALRFTALQDYVRKPLAPQHQNRGPGETPARRLQRFNGFTDLMGGAEGVPAWRSGVNYGQTPVYGYQAMDFILNTLMSNPYVLQKVKEAESKVGRKSPSVVCEDLAAGSYTMDSDFYFKKHGQAPRMGTIKAKWDSGAKTWDSLSKRQQKVSQ